MTKRDSDTPGGELTAPDPEVGLTVGEDGEETVVVLRNPDEGDAPAEAEEAPHEATPEEVGGWQPTIVEPAPDPEPEDGPESSTARPALPEGSYDVVYRGVADLAGPVVHDGVSYTFRPDQPVTVPSAVAEEVLTWPNETFEVVNTED